MEDLKGKKMHKFITINKLSVQVCLATIMVIAGITLLGLGFYAVPLGEISASVLTAFGECATFAGSLLGLDYNYKIKMYKVAKHNEEEVEQ